MVDGADEYDVFQASFGEDAVAVFIGVAGADDNEAGVGVVPLEAAVSVKEVAEALALFHAANEEDVDLIVAEFRDWRNVGGEEIEVYAVGDDCVVVGEETVDVALGGGGDGDAAVKAAEVGFEKGAAPTVHTVAAVEGVEGAHVYGAGAVEDGEGEVGGEGFVEVDDVELFAAEDVADAAVEPGGEGDASDGAAAGDGDAAAEGDEILLLAVDPVRGEGSKNLNVVAHISQPVAELRDVGGHAAGPSEVVGGDQGDFQGAPPGWNDMEASEFIYRR